MNKLTVTTRQFVIDYSLPFLKLYLLWMSYNFTQKSTQYRLSESKNLPTRKRRIKWLVSWSRVRGVSYDLVAWQMFRTLGQNPGKKKHRKTKNQSTSKADRMKKRSLLAFRYRDHKRRWQMRTKARYNSVCGRFRYRKRGKFISFS